MSFKLLRRDQIRTKVTIKEPLDFGKFNTVSVDVTWKNLTTSEAKDIRQELQDSRSTDKELLQRLVVNVDGFLDEAGEKIPFSAEVLDQALEHRCVLEAFSLALTEQLFGKGVLEALRQKN